MTTNLSWDIKTKCYEHSADLVFRQQETNLYVAFNIEYFDYNLDFYFDELERKQDLCEAIRERFESIVKQTYGEHVSTELDKEQLKHEAEWINTYINISYY